MSRQFVSSACPRLVLLSARDSAPLLGPRRSVFTPRQGQLVRRCFSHKAPFRPRVPTRTWLWICGAGVGVSVAVGLKHSLCEEEQTPVAAGDRSERYRAAAAASREQLLRIQAVVGAPGLVVGVSVDGQQVWCEGMGFADLENRVPCGPDTMMRIASISKPLTSAAAARLCEDGTLDLDAPVQEYVPEFPLKQFDGQDVTITSRMILSHLSGIRHYEKDVGKVRESRERARRPPWLRVEEKDDESSEPQIKYILNNQSSEAKEKETAKTQNKKKEFEHEEYYLKENFEGVIQSLELFKDDPLVYKPGSTFLYSTHAFTLLSAVMERAANQRFLDLMMNMFRELGMMHTLPDENEPIVYHRARYYHRNKKGHVVNCPYVDNSYKWAGGGFLSTAGDLLLFGNALLYSFQAAPLADAQGSLPGFLRPGTSAELWAPVAGTDATWDKDGLYAQGWLVVEKRQEYGQCRRRRHYVSHTGGAVGASSVLLVLPAEDGGGGGGSAAGAAAPPPRGVVVTVITNLQSVGLNGVALKIALEFDKARGPC